MKKVSLEVNGKKVSKEVPDHTLLSVFLRDILNLTGTHVGWVGGFTPHTPQRASGAPRHSGQ